MQFGSFVYQFIKVKFLCGNCNSQNRSKMSISQLRSTASFVDVDHLNACSNVFMKPSNTYIFHAIFHNCKNVVLLGETRTKIFR